MACLVVVAIGDRFPARLDGCGLLPLLSQCAEKYSEHPQLGSLVPAVVARHTQLMGGLQGEEGEEEIEEEGQVEEGEEEEGEGEEDEENPE